VLRLVNHTKYVNTKPTRLTIVTQRKTELMVRVCVFTSVTHPIEVLKEDSAGDE
jgi:hypothetical protein